MVDAPPGGMASQSPVPGLIEPPGIGCLDGRLCYAWLNKRLAAINGLPVAAHLGGPAGRIGPLGEAITELLGLAADGEEDCQREAWPEADWPRCYRITLIPRRQAGGGLSGAAVLVADITREKSADWALAEQRLMQQAFAEASPHFGGGQWRELAHELRNRLTPMLTMAQMLRGAEGLDAQTLAWAGQSMEKKVLELVGLVNAWPKKSSPGGAATQPAADLRELALRALEAVRPQLAGHSLSLPAGTARVLADPARLAAPLALCLLLAARQGAGLALGIRAEAGQALLEITASRPARHAGSPAPWPRGRDTAPPGGDMGLFLARLLIEDQRGSLAISRVEGDPAGIQIAVRLPLAGYAPPG